MEGFFGRKVYDEQRMVWTFNDGSSSLPVEALYEIERNMDDNGKINILIAMAIRDKYLNPFLRQNNKRLLEMVKNSLKGQSTHGECCTCQKCNNSYDDCSCFTMNIIDSMIKELE